MSNTIYNPAQEIIDDAQYLIKKGINNSVSFINEFNEFRKSRNFGSLQQMSKDLFDELIKTYNQYILSNGLFVKSLFKFTFNEHQSFCFNILCRNPQKYQNHWYTYISNYIFGKYDEDIKEIELEDLKCIQSYYNESLSRKIKKYIGDVPKITTDDSPNMDPKLVNSFVKIGENIKYDVKGFFDNELLYLLCGLCIVDGINREFDSFYSLFKFVKSFLQLWQFNKIFEFKFGDNQNTATHNLVTHIKSKGNYVKRYKTCEKYFIDWVDTDQGSSASRTNTSKTKYKVDKIQDSIYIETKLSKQEINDIWKTLETLFKEEDKELDLYYFYVTSQLLTRSTCLSALIILNILWYKRYNKFIKTKKNEQLDWFAISVDVNKFKKQINKYTDELTIEDVPKIDKLKVSDVLNYTHYYIASRLNKA